MCLALNVVRAKKMAQATNRVVNSPNGSLFSQNISDQNYLINVLV